LVFTQTASWAKAGSLASIMPSWFVSSAARPWNVRKLLAVIGLIPLARTRKPVLAPIHPVGSIPLPKLKLILDWFNETRLIPLPLILSTSGSPPSPPSSPPSSPSSPLPLSEIPEPMVSTGGV